MNLAAAAILATMAIVLAFAPSGDRQDPADLTDRGFVALSLHDDEVEREIVAGTEIVVGFTEEGLGWHAGCNWFGAEASFSSRRIRPTAVEQTLIGCEGLREQEDFVAGLIADGVWWRLDGEQLVLSNGSRSLVLEERPPE